MYGNYNPYQAMMPQAPQQTLQRVNGIDGAKAFQIGANSTVALFDSNADVFYVKSTDNAGFPTIRIFKFEEISTCSKMETVDYVSREEMEEYVKQFIQSQSTSKSKSNATTKSTTDADS